MLGQQELGRKFLLADYEPSRTDETTCPFCHQNNCSLWWDLKCLFLFALRGAVMLVKGAEDPPDMVTLV